MFNKLVDLRFYKDLFRNVKKSELFQYVKENTSIWVSFLVSLLAFLFFFSISYPVEFYNIFPFISIRLFGLYITAIILSTTLLFGILKYDFSREFLSTFFQSNLLTFFSFSYIMGVEQSRFFSIIIVILTGLIFLVNWDIFGEKNYFFYLTLAQVFLFTFQSFSWLNFLLSERIELLQFQQDLIKNVLTLAPSYWLILSSVAVGLISASSWQKTGPGRKFWFGLLFAILMYQFFWIFNELNFLNIFYWQKTLLFLIVWDFLYQPTRSIVASEEDSNFQSKLWISAIYHFLLILLVFVIAKVVSG